MPGLALPVGRHDRAVGVEIGDRAEQVPTPPGHSCGRTALIASISVDHVGLAEAAAEVACRGRVRDQVRAQGVHVRRVMAQPLDVLQPRAAAQHVVGQVQHMIGLVVRQVHLQQLQPVIDLLDQPQLGDQPVHRGDPAEAGRVDVAADLVAHLARGQHRRRPGTPMPRQRVTRGHLASPPRRVPPTLIMRYLLHRKGLSCPGCVKVANPGRLRPFSFKPPVQHVRHAWSRTSAHPAREAQRRKPSCQILPRTARFPL